MHRSTWRRGRRYPVFSPSAPVSRADRDDWSALQPGDRVTVQERGWSYEAVVDILTNDCRVVWILPVMLGQRRAFHHLDDVDISVTFHAKTKRTG